MFAFLVYPRGSIRLLELCPTHAALLYFWVHVLYKLQDCLIPFAHTSVSVTYINPSSAFKQIVYVSPRTSCSSEQIKDWFFTNILAPLLPQAAAGFMARECWNTLSVGARSVRTARSCSSLLQGDICWSQLPHEGVDRGNAARHPCGRRGL